MQAEIIFTGTELLLGQILNTNAQYIQQVLSSLGIDLYYQVTVGDNLLRLSEAITQASERANLIIISGGLGPTADDLSREALAKSLDVPLIHNEQALKIVKRFFDERHLRMPDNNLKQATVPAGGIVIDNPIGTAPGILLEHRERIYILIPGPPSEFKMMVDNEFVPFLHQKLGNQQKIIKSRVVKLCGVGESVVDERLGNLLDNTNPTLAGTAKFAEVHLRITSKASSLEEAVKMNTDMEEKIRERLGRNIFGTDDETLADSVAKGFAKRNLTLASIETFTAGLLTYELTAAPDSENYFKVGHVLGINKKMWAKNIPSIEANDREQAEILASWGQKNTNSDVCIAVTGRMKDGATGKKQPGGIVYIATNMHGKTRVGEFNIWGMISDVRERAVQIALSILWRMI